MFTSRWIIHFERLFKESQSKNRKGVKILFIISTKKKTDRLIKNGLNFKYIKKSVLYFQKVDFRTIYYKYCEMGHEKPKVCGDRLSIYKIYGKNYYINNYTYNILICKARKKRRYLYDLIKYGNYTNIN